MDAQYHVPCCPRCSIPLRPDETDARHGVCPSLHCPAKGEVFTEESWRWIHQDVFNQSECPPWNGFEAIQVDAPRWVDLLGADPDFTNGKPTDEWLDEQRGDA